ncbi:MAG: AI-2E family transporter [Thermomicrobiales bacterium]|nr:AI-2E family transporter [Thermomicrobiales bacterium]
MESQGQRTITVSISLRTIFLIIALVALTYLFFRIPHFWLLVLTALVLATAIDKPVTALHRRGVPRGLSILAIYVLLIALLAVAIAALAPIVAGDARALERELPGYTAWFEKIAASLPSSAEGAASLSLEGLEQQLRDHATTLARGATEVGVEAGRTAFYVFVTLVLAFFLCVEPEVLLGGAQRWIPAKHQDRVWRIARNIHESIGAWARGQLAIALIFGALMGLGLKLIGVPYALSLGVIAGILEVVPYVGGFITVVLAVLSAATVGLPQVIAVLVLYVVLVNLESHVLAPLLYGKALGLPPVAILLALLAGVELLGLLGALLAIPLTVIIWAIAEEFAPPKPPATAAEAPTEPASG